MLVSYNLMYRLLAPLKLFSIFDLFLATAVGVLSIVIFIIYKISRSTEDKVDTIVRKIALQELKTKK